VTWSTLHSNVNWLVFLNIECDESNGCAAAQ